MIFDTLENANRYSTLSEPFEAVVHFLHSTNLSSLPDGRHDLRGNDLYVMVKRYQTRPPEQGVWEAHRKYIDIQYMVEGREIIGFANLAAMHVTGYEEDRDWVSLTGKGHDLLLFPTAFAVFFPEDAHMPELADDLPQQVFKLVFKIAVDSAR